jgi:hypothetical protein
MLYGKECWAVKNQHENKISVAKMRMLHWMCGKNRHDRIINDSIIVKTRVRWFGHVERRHVDSIVWRVVKPNTSTHAEDMMRKT